MQDLFFDNADSIAPQGDLTQADLLLKLLDLVNHREKLNATLQNRTSNTLFTVVAVLDAIIEESCKYVSGGWGGFPCHANM